ncbi:hypothetical protein [Nonomuraea lactucae]|uniref:hypothetical protein n=1 Tax=Nonomuraea lactucae TaxID=2249762 RepID=UPI0013B3AABE|nr:hypothetical protein [Nonomuraea lactucae]
MSPPENTKAARPGAALDPMTIKATSNAKPQGSRSRRARHVAGQLPLVRSATAYAPAWGMVTVLIVLDQECECGFYHAHRVKAPAPVLLRRTARCGARYELALHAPRVRRRKAA